MHTPPDLTMRERQILPLLVSGTSRLDIAETLDVSPETIKKHTSSILNKFEAVSLRDGYEEMRDYVEYYCGDLPQFDLFCIEFDAHLTLDQTRNELYYKMTHRFKSVTKPIAYTRVSSLEDLFTIKSVRINNKPKEPVLYEMGKRIYECRYDPPVAKGKVFERETEMVFDLNDHGLTDSYYTVWPVYPTATMTLSLDFVGPNTPNRVWSEIQMNSVPIEDPTTTLSQNDQRWTLHMRTPELGRHYLIRWQW